MRQVKRWRYYCDFCKKSGSSSGAMAKHEKGCTRNPGRECGMCRYAEHAQQPMAVLIEAARAAREVHASAVAIHESQEWRDGEIDPDITTLAKLADGCPACILSALIQERTSRGATLSDHPEIHYDYAKESKLFLEAYRPDEAYV